MQKTEAYHEAAIKYNEGLAEAAEALAPSLEHEEPKKWCIAVGKQHRFHAKRHKSALEKLRNRQEAPPVEHIPDGLDVPEPAEEDAPKIVHEPVQPPGPAAPAEGVVTASNAENVKVSTTFSDGCVDEHKPLENENCEFYPGGANG